MWSIFQILDDDCVIGVLDIGASLTSTPPYQALVDTGRARVVAFEPDAHECERLAEQLPPPHRVVQAFLGNGEEAVFHQTNWSATGSLLKPNARIMSHFSDWENWVKLEATHRVNTTRLDDIKDLGPADFIKIDVQGAELDILGNGLSALDSALVIQCEISFVESYLRQPFFADIDAFLRARGFQYHMIEGFGARRFRGFPDDQAAAIAFHQQLWADAVYVKDWDRLETLSGAQLQRYAALAHEVLRSFDLAYKILAEHDRQTGSALAERYLKRHRHSSDSRLALRKEASGASPSSTNELLIETDDGIRYSVPQSLTCITTYALLEQERWFENEVPFLRRCLGRGDTVIDIGANLGLYALPLADAVGPDGRVFAYEPGPSNRSHLERTLGLNGVANITVSGCALSNFQGSGWLKQSWSGELDSLVPTPEVQGSVDSVPVTTLDTLAASGLWEKVDLVKLDAEGQEARIIAGGREFFRDRSPLVMYEVTTGAEEYPELRWIFETLGYRTFRLLGDGSMLVPVEHDEIVDPSLLNLFAAKPDRALDLANRNLLVPETIQADRCDAESDAAIRGFLDLAYAGQFEIGANDIAQCPFGDALIDYAAYLFLPETGAARRHSFLSRAFHRLAEFCRTSSHPSALSTFARVALDFGYRKIAADALKTLSTTALAEVDLPFFPASHRFDGIRPGDHLDTWFRMAAYEQFELTRSWSSQFLCDLPRLEQLCASDYASAELLRRTILVAMNQGVSRRRIQGYLDCLGPVQIRNREVWQRQVDDIYALWGI